MPEPDAPRTDQVDDVDGPLLRDPPPPPGWVDPLEGTDSLDELLQADSEE